MHSHPGTRCARAAPAGQNRTEAARRRCAERWIRSGGTALMSTSTRHAGMNATSSDCTARRSNQAACVSPTNSCGERATIASAAARGTSGMGRPQRPHLGMLVSGLQPREPTAWHRCHAGAGRIARRALPVGRLPARARQADMAVRARARMADDGDRRAERLMVPELRDTGPHVRSEASPALRGSPLV